MLIMDFFEIRLLRMGGDGFKFLFNCVILNFTPESLKNSKKKLFTGVDG